MSDGLKRFLILIGVLFVISFSAVFVGVVGESSGLYAFETGQRLTWVMAFALAFGGLLERMDLGR